MAGQLSVDVAERRRAAAVPDAPPTGDAQLSEPLKGLLHELVTARL